MNEAPEAFFVLASVQALPAALDEGASGLPPPLLLQCF
jgi:hypothetical protein